VLARIAAVKISGCTLQVSIPSDLNNNITEFLKSKEGKKILGDGVPTYEHDKNLIKKMHQVQLIRYGAQDRVPFEVFKEAAKTGFYISRTKVMMEGRIELLHYFHEQSISDNYHRYGNLGERAWI
jgi:RHH-type proline utilization regulon transcriptional repressor/proline dehydrogenase/delta 1-pyrroline-5-carboxylate dehydrogenase